MNFSQNELRLIEKFGFQIEGRDVVHRKMGVKRGVEHFQRFSSLADLEDYIKALLRAS